MRKFLYRIDCIVLLFVMLIFASSCGRTKTIPDDELGDIFRDIYIANAYQSLHYRTVDTVDLYTPILDSYGYDIDDFKGTMLGFAKRKNSKLSLIIEAAIKQIDKKFYDLEGKIEVLDTIEARSMRILQDTLIYNKHINVKSVKDTSKLRLAIAVQPGNYLLSYIADVDSLDINRSLKGTHCLYDSLGKRLTYDNYWFGKDRKRYSVKIVVPSNASKLVLNLGNYGHKLKRPSLVIDSLSVIYQLPKKQAIDSINSIFINKLFIDGTEWTEASQDSITLHISPPRISSGSGDNSQ